MSEIYFPESLDLITICLIPIVLLVFGTVISSLIKGDMKVTKAVLFLLVAVLGSALVILFWYNAIPDLYNFMGNRIKDTTGCAQAIWYYERAIQINPKNTRARINFVDCNIKSGLPEDILRVLEPLEKTLRSNIPYWQELTITYSLLNNHDKMIESLKRALIMDSENIQWAIDIGEKYHLAFEYITSEEIFRNIRVRNSNNSLAVYWLSWTLFEQFKYNDALKHFDICINIMPDNMRRARCYAGKGFTLQKLGDYSEALKAFNTSLGIYPDQEDIYQWTIAIGENYYDELRYSEAEDIFRSVRVRNPNNPLATYWLARVLFERFKYNDALSHFDICISIMPNTMKWHKARCYAGKGFTLQKLGNYSEALNAFNSSLGMDPNQEDVQKAKNSLNH